jgi:hypothetical protein
VLLWMILLVALCLMHCVLVSLLFVTFEATHAVK